MATKTYTSLLSSKLEGYNQVYFKILMFLIFIIFQLNSYSQGLALEIGYNNQYSKNVQLGLSYKILDDEQPLNISVSYATNFNTTEVWALGFQKRVLYFFDVGSNFLIHELEPIIGINLLNMLKLQLSYTIPYEKNMANFFSFRILLALCSKSYYDDLKIIQ